MTYPSKIDLHIHTKVSDGTDLPAEIIAHVSKSGIGLFSVTDHDAVKACRVILSLLAESDPAFITGVELSCRDEQGKYHILGYGYDPDAESIRKLVDKGHRIRIGKVSARLDRLKSEFGISFPQDELDALFALDNPGKPHIANMMVSHGFAQSKEQAIREFIDRIRLKNEFISPEEAIRGIRDSGGIAILAHPSYGDGDQLILGEEMDERLRLLMDLGLQGVEAFYSGFTPRLCREMLSFAERYALYVTAGSDYHGENKMVMLGDTGLGDSGEWPEGLRRFLKDARIHGQHEI